MVAAGPAKAEESGFGSQDLGALSTFFNESVVSEIDPSIRYSLRLAPTAVSQFIKKTKTLKKLRSEPLPHSEVLSSSQTFLSSLVGISFDPAGALTLIQTLVWSFSRGNFTLQSLELVLCFFFILFLCLVSSSVLVSSRMDEVGLTSFDGLSMIPRHLEAR